MEPEKKKLVHLDEEANLAAYRQRYNKLVIIFKSFFIFLTLTIAALITYLVRSEFSEQSIYQNPSPQIADLNTTTQSQVFKLSLQNAAQQLEIATSLLLSSHDDTFSRCRKWLQTGSAQLREAIRADPFPPEQRSEMANRVAAAEVYIDSCIDDLASTAESSASANEVRVRVLAAAAYLGERGNFLATPPKFVEIAWDLIFQNVIVVCFFGFQMVVIFFFFWTMFKSP